MNEQIWNNHNTLMRLSKNLRARATREQRKGNLKESQRCFHKAARYDRRVTEILVR